MWKLSEIARTAPTADARDAAMGRMLTLALATADTEERAIARISLEEWHGMMFERDGASVRITRVEPTFRDTHDLAPNVIPVDFGCRRHVPDGPMSEG